MTYDQIKELIDAFRTETQADSITPDTLGQLIQKILDYASDEGVIKSGLQELIDKRDDALNQIGTAESEAKSNVSLAKEDALDAIEEAIEGLEVHYDIESDKGAVKEVQLKDGQGNRLMPQTDAEVVDVNNSTLDKVISSVIADNKEIKYKELAENIGRYYINAQGQISESTYVVTKPITLHPYQTINTVDALTCNSSPWIWGYNIETESYYSLGVPTLSGAHIREYTNNSDKTIQIVFQYALSTSTDESKNLQQYQITTLTTKKEVPFNIWQERNSKGLSVGYITDIGKVASFGIYNSNYYGHIVFPVKKGERIKIGNMKSTADRATWAFVETFTRVIIDGKLVSGNTNATANIIIEAPKDCLLVVNNSTSTSSDNQFIYIDGVDEIEYKRRMTENLHNDNYCYKDYGADNAVLFNTELLSKFQYSANTFKLFHFSDLHADLTNLKTMIEFYKAYSTLVDDMLNTGDTVQSTYSDGTWEQIVTIEGFGNILNTIGNHDGATNTSPTGWEGIAKTDVYERYFKPYIENWEVQQPLNAEESGKCYYYKDYASKSVRLIVLDSIMSDYTEQTEWLAEVLENARQNSLHVVIAQHSPILIGTQINSDYTVGAVAEGGFYPNRPAIEVVDAFITNGGKFVCWLCGHTHFDDMRFLPDHSNQLMICVSTAKLQASLRYRRRNNKHQELFNFYEINTTGGWIKIIRIGAGLDGRGKKLDMIGVDYINHTIL